MNDNAIHEINEKSFEEIYEEFKSIFKIKSNEKLMSYLNSVNYESKNVCAKIMKKSNLII